MYIYRHRMHAEIVYFRYGYISPKSNMLTSAQSVTWAANASLWLPKCFKHHPSIAFTGAIFEGNKR